MNELSDWLNDLEKVRLDTLLKNIKELKHVIKCLYLITNPSKENENDSTDDLNFLFTSNKEHKEIAKNILKTIFQAFDSDNFEVSLNIKRKIKNHHRPVSKRPRTKIVTEKNLKRFKNNKEVDEETSKRRKKIISSQCIWHGDIQKGLRMACNICEEETKLFYKIAQQKNYTVQLKRTIKGWICNFSCRFNHKFKYTSGDPECLKCKKYDEDMEKLRQEYAKTNEQRQTEQKKIFIEANAKLNKAFRPKKEINNKLLLNDKNKLLNHLSNCDEKTDPFYILLISTEEKSEFKQDKLISLCRNRFKTMALKIHPDKCSDPRSKNAFTLLDHAMKAVSNSSNI